MHGALRAMETQETVLMRPNKILTEARVGGEGVGTGGGCPSSRGFCILSSASLPIPGSLLHFFATLVRPPSPRSSTFGLCMTPQSPCSIS